jgi:hypothetical protein
MEHVGLFPVREYSTSLSFLETEAPCEPEREHPARGDGFSAGWNLYCFSPSSGQFSFGLFLSASWESSLDRAALLDSCLLRDERCDEHADGCDGDPYIHVVNTSRG